MYELIYTIVSIVSIFIFICFIYRKSFPKVKLPKNVIKFRKKPFHKKHIKPNSKDPKTHIDYMWEEIKNH